VAAFAGQRVGDDAGTLSFRETLIYSEDVIATASEARREAIQNPAKSKASGSPRRFAPRDDGIV
jgi:hypothetical protein